MAKAEKPKKENSRGRSKAAGRAGTQTEKNKRRAAETRTRRHAAAERRRQSGEYVVPMNAMIPSADLPRKNYNALVEACNEAGIAVPEFVPDPRRGMKLTRGPRLSEIVRRREEQIRRIARKRRQREAFSALSHADKREHREAGKAHRLPR